MKYIFTVLFFLICMHAVFRQAPESFNYQAIARNASGNALGNQTIGLRLSIMDGALTGTILYMETFSVTTNSFGLFTVAVGKGVPETGTFSAITWSSGSKFLKTELDTSGGKHYILAGETQLLSVPYALYANSFGSGGGGGNSYWSVLNGNIYNTNERNIGIGTNTPAVNLDIHSTSVARSLSSKWF